MPSPLGVAYVHMMSHRHANSLGTRRVEDVNLTPAVHSQAMTTPANRDGAA